MRVLIYIPHEARKYLRIIKSGKAFLYSIDEDLVKKIDAVQRG